MDDEIKKLEAQLSTEKYKVSELKKNQKRCEHIQEENKKLRAEAKEDREYKRKYDHFRKYEHAPLVKENKELIAQVSTLKETIKNWEEGI